MTKHFLICSLCLCAYGVFGQGQINLISNGFQSPVYGVEKYDGTVTLPPTRDKLGAGYTFEIWYAAGENKAESDLKALVRGDFVKNGVFLKSGSVDIPGVWGGGKVTLQVRAWANDSRIDSWADLENPDNGDVARGRSNIITRVAGGKDAAGNVVLPLSLVGQFDSFFLHLDNRIPEPSVIALSVLGLGALVLRRRK